MSRNKDPFLRRLHPRWTDEQCCQIVAMRDVRGVKAVESHYGIPAKIQTKLSAEVKSRPHLDAVYWQYRNALARRWANQLGETMNAVLVRITQAVQEEELDPYKLGALTKAAEVIGDIGVSLAAVAPDAIEQETPRYQIIDEVLDAETEDDQLLLEGSIDADR